MALAVRAREAMPGGGTFTVTVGDVESLPANEDPASVPHAMVGGIVVRVADTGVVADRDALDRMFEPFPTSACQPWESGLALATAHALVVRSGGHISVRSAPGDGTVFTISLPSPVAQDAPPAANVRQPRNLSGCETVLLAEDEDGVRELVRAGLARLGYNVIDAPDGATALERAAAHAGRIDLLITDVVMPGMSARELTERLLTLHPKAKVLYMSGYSDAAIEGQGILEWGAVLLQKPFTPEALARRVREMLG
jgi:CheY-like chemotaxis protein